MKIKFESLKRKADFSRILKEGIYKKYKCLVIYILKKPDDNCSLRIGFIISKKIIGAVLRNKIKRIVKEVLRKSNIKIYSSFDILFVIRKRKNKINLRELKRWLEDNLVLFLTEKL